MSSKHILVIRLSAMGDVAMSVPVIRALLKQNSNIKITVVSNDFFKPIFEGIAQVNFYTVDVQGKHKGISGLYKLYKELNKLNIDAIADIHNVLRTKILRFFFSLKRINTAIINKGRAEKKALTRAENKVFKQLKTTHERYADVFRKLGFTVDLSNPEFPKRKNVPQSPPFPLGEDGKKWVGIAPFAQHQSKMYPLDLMEEVITNLVATNQYQIFLFGGGAQEIKELKILAQKFKAIILIAGNLSFNEELSLISNLDGMLSMDSANAHLAAMQGIKTITLWGGTHPFAGFAPFNQAKEHMLLSDIEKYPKLPCSVYGNKICDGYQDIMRSISPEMVAERVKKIC